MQVASRNGDGWQASRRGVGPPPSSARSGQAAKVKTGPSLYRSSQS